MKLAIVALLFAAVALAAVEEPSFVSLYEGPSFSVFKDWALRNDKDYIKTRMQQSPEALLRFEIFRSNARGFVKKFASFATQAHGVAEGENIARRLVSELRANIRGGTYSFVDSKFADRTEEESRSRVMPKRPVPESFKNLPRKKAAPVQTVPDAFDWRDSGNRVSPVKDQGDLGTCFAFSAIGSIEGQLAPAGYALTDLSVEPIVECDNSYDPVKNQGDCSVFGGWPWVAMDWFKTRGGLRTAKDFVYAVDAKPDIYPCMPTGYSKKFCGDHSDMSCNASTTQGQGPQDLCDSSKGSVYARVGAYSPIDKDPATIQQALVDGGPLSVCLNAEWLSYYSSGIFDPMDLLCDPESLDHAVLAVGYGVDNGTTPYWTVKNSWGESWGEKGYFRIRRGTNKCGIESVVVEAAVQHK